MCKMLAPRRCRPRDQSPVTRPIVRRTLPTRVFGNGAGVYIAIANALYMIRKIRRMLTPTTQFAMDECLEMAENHKHVATEMRKAEKRIMKLKKDADRGTQCPEKTFELVVKSVRKTVREKDVEDVETEIQNLSKEVARLEIKIKQILRNRM